MKPKNYVGFTNVQTMFGFPVRRLEDETAAFARFPFGYDPNMPQEWVRTESLTPILETFFSGCDSGYFSVKAQAKEASYGDWRKYDNAVEVVGTYSFVVDGPIKATCSNSFHAPNGALHVMEVMRERQREGQELGRQRQRDSLVIHHLK
jgi:hypothetical protein